MAPEHLTMSQKVGRGRLDGLQASFSALRRDPESGQRGGDAVDVVGVLGADAEREQLPGRAVDDPQLPAAVDAAEALPVRIGRAVGGGGGGGGGVAGGVVDGGNAGGV